MEIIDTAISIAIIVGVYSASGWEPAVLAALCLTIYELVCIKWKMRQ